MASSVGLCRDRYIEKGICPETETKIMSMLVNEDNVVLRGDGTLVQGCSRPTWIAPQGQDSFKKGRRSGDVALGM